MNLFVESRYDESLSLVSQIDPNYFVMKLYLRFHKGMCLNKIEDYDLFLNE
ncbi:MAG: hypothetical protein ABI462_01035 [Ignavibacteria bacterium]